MRRAAAFLLRVTAGVLAVTADVLEPLAPDFLDEMIAERAERDPDFADMLAEHELPWPERRPSCVNYRHEAYYASE